MGAGAGRRSRGRVYLGAGARRPRPRPAPISRPGNLARTPPRCVRACARTAARPLGGGAHGAALWSLLSATLGSRPAGGPETQPPKFPRPRASPGAPSCPACPRLFAKRVCPRCGLWLPTLRRANDGLLLRRAGVSERVRRLCSAPRPPFCSTERGQASSCQVSPFLCTRCVPSPGSDAEDVTNQTVPLSYGRHSPVGGHLPRRVRDPKGEGGQDSTEF